MRLFFGDADEQPRGNVAVVESAQVVEVTAGETPTVRFRAAKKKRAKAKKGAKKKPTRKPGKSAKSTTTRSDAGAKKKRTTPAKTGKVGRPTKKVRAGFGLKVTKARREKGWTQPQLAEATGLSLSCIASVELTPGKGIRQATRAALKKALGF